MDGAVKGKSGLMGIEGILLDPSGGALDFLSVPIAERRSNEVVLLLIKEVLKIFKGSF